MLALADEEEKYRTMFRLPLEDNDAVILKWKTQATITDAGNDKSESFPDPKYFSSFSIQKKLSVYAHSVSRLAIPIDEAFSLCTKHSPASTESLFIKPNAMFPKLDELICILRPHMIDEDTTEDLEDVAVPRVNGSLKKECALEGKMADMIFVTSLFSPDSKGINVPKLTFMRKKDNNKGIKENKVKE
jgi:hypothetical protein